MVIFKLEELIVATIKENEKPVYNFNIGQRVRIKSTLTCDTVGIEDMLGQVGIIESRRCTMFASEKWYNVKIGNHIEPFREYELDYRYGKRILK